MASDKLGYSLYFKTPQNPGYWFDLSRGVREISRDRTSLNQYVPLPHKAVYRGLNGEGLGSIRISGTFGIEKRQVGSQQLSGQEQYKLLEKLISEYLEATSSPDRSLRDSAIIEFHDWGKNYHLYVEPQQFSESHGPRNKIHVNYSLQLESYGTVKRRVTSVVLGGRDQASQYLKAMKAASDAIKSTGAKLRREQERLKNYTDQYVVRPVNNLINALDDFSTGLVGWVDFPFQAGLDIANNANAAASSISDRASEEVVSFAVNLRQIARLARRIVSTGDLIRASWSQTAAELANAFGVPLENSDSDVQREEKLFGMNAERRQRGQRLAQASAQGARRVPIYRGDTLQGIALRELGEASRWFEISLLNGLADNDSLTSMTEILIPSDSPDGGVVSRQLSSSSFLTQDIRLYGRDIRIVTSSRAKISVSFHNNDLSLVSGLDNLQQAVYLAERVQLGEMLEDPLYGIRAIVGASQSRQRAAALAWSLKETAERDPRVSSCDVLVTTEGNSTKYERTISPVGTTARLSSSSIAGGI